jgi:hypothetical protein
MPETIRICWQILMPELGKKRKGLVCFECGIQADHAHHVVPKILGGTKTVNLCAPCHSKVHSPHLLRTSELTKLGMQKRREKGLTIGPIASFGTKHVNGVVKIVEKEQKIIKQMIAMKEQGLSLKKIADHFADKGLKNRYGKRLNGRNVYYIFRRL